MASWNGGSDSDGENKDSFLKPSDATSRLAPKPSTEIRPDSEEHVQEETEDLFQNFVYQRFRNDNIQQPYDNTPVDEAIINFPKVPNTTAAEIGRHLAKVGDDIYERHKDDFRMMINRLNIGPGTAYEAFAGVARKIFDDGINWGRIVTLLCFGYQIAVQVLRDHMSHFASFLRKIGQYILQFLVTERIARWIAERGGWRAALTFTPAVDDSVFFTIISLAAISVVAVIAWHRYSL